MHCIPPDTVSSSNRAPLFSLVLLVIIFLFLPQAGADSRPELSSLEGFARIEWTKKKKVYRFDQAVVIHGTNEATFETLDDFGNTLLKFSLGESSIRLKDLSLPLSKEEFLAALLYRLPPQLDNLIIERRPDGSLLTITRKGSPKKSVKISFFDLRKRGRITYPNVIEITSHKTKLRIEWQSVKFLN